MPSSSSAGKPARAAASNGPPSSDKFLQWARPEVRALVALARLAALRGPGRMVALPHRHRRAIALFHVMPIAAAVPAGYVRQDVFFPDPWWTADVVQRDHTPPPDAPGRPDGSVVLHEARHEITLLDGRVVTHLRREVLTREGRRRKEFVAEVEGGRQLPFDDLPHGLLPLYFAPSSKPGDRRVVVCEGIPAASAVARRGIAAVASLTGALGTPSRAALRTIVDRAPIVLWPDNDDVGARHMQRTAENLRALGAQDIRVLRWVGAPRKADAADFSGSDAELETLLAGAVPWTTQSPVSSHGVLAVRPPRAALQLRLDRAQQPAAPAIAPPPPIVANARALDAAHALRPALQMLASDATIAGANGSRLEALMARLESLLDTRTSR